MAGKLVRELHADGGVVTHGYNAFGEKVSLTDAMGNTTAYRFDQLGRQVAISGPSTQAYEVNASNTLVSQGAGNWATTMTYDQAGRLLTQTNGAGETTRYAYDARGNIIATVDAMNRTVMRRSFDAQDRAIAEQNGNDDVTIKQLDYYGQLVSRTDLGAASYSYQYDKAGQLTRQTNSRGQDIGYQYDAAGNLLHVTDTATGKASHYAYDARGARLLEQTTQQGQNFQLQSMAYDALGRLIRVEAPDDGIVVTRDYDAAGNLLRQQVVSNNVALPDTTLNISGNFLMGQAWTQTGTETYQTGIDPVTGQPIMGTRPVYGFKPFYGKREQVVVEATNRHTQTQWFAYDTMNRQTLVDGAIDGNAANRANLTVDQGHILTYDKNGNRISDTRFGRQVVETARPYALDEAGNPLLDENGHMQYGFDANGHALSTTKFSVELGPLTETYAYDAQNRVTDVRHVTVNSSGQPAGTQRTIDTRYYDKAGRLAQNGPATALNAEFVEALTGQALTASGIATRKSRYNAAGQLISQQVLKADGSRSYELYYEDIDALGNVRRHTVNDDDKAQTFTHEYDRRDSYLEKKVHGTRSDNPNTPSDVITTYDVNGHVKTISETVWPDGSTGFPGQAAQPGYWDADGEWVPPTPYIPPELPDQPLVRDFVTDANGTVLRKLQQGHVLKQLVVQGQVVSSYGKGIDSNKPLDDKGKPNYVDQGDYSSYTAIDSRSAGGSSMR